MYSQQRNAHEEYQHADGSEKCARDASPDRYLRYVDLRVLGLL
jgi:hypothetical protein